MEKHTSVADRLARMKVNYMKEGMRTSESLVVLRLFGISMQMRQKRQLSGLMVKQLMEEILWFSLQNMGQMRNGYAFGAWMWSPGRMLTKIGLFLKQILSRPRINIIYPLRGGMGNTITLKRWYKKTSLRNSKSQWKDLPEEILEMIFGRLDDIVLFETVYRVCQSWRSVSRPLIYWRSDGLVSFNFLKRTCAGGAEEASQFMELLKIVLDELERQSKAATRIVLPQSIYISDDHLSYITKRLPNIQGLHLPYTTEKITATGFSNAIKCLKDLKNFSVGPIKSFDYNYVMLEIGRNLKNLNYLRLNGQVSKKIVRASNSLVINRYTSRTLINNTCNVERLVLNHCLLYKSGLETILSESTSFHLIIIIMCKHAYSRNYPSLVSYTLQKRVTEDECVEWNVWQEFDDEYYPGSTIVTRLF